MGDLPSPAMSPRPPLAAFKLPVLYYGLVVVGTAALVLLLYNLIIIKWCNNVVGTDRARTRRAGEPARRVEWSDGNLVNSFKYKMDSGDVREGKEGLGRSSDYECAVCLSVFEAGEDVRRLPRCDHSFHATCIDMWLYSHCDCPLCRAPVLNLNLNANANSPAGLI